MKKKAIIISIAAVVLVGIIVFFVIKSSQKELELHTAVVQKEVIETTVTATGYVQPVDKVDVGTQVSGVIEKIYVDFNSQVKKGQLLAELDKSTLKERLNQTKASLASAQSTLTYAEQNYNRVKQLYEVNAATQASYEEAINSLAQAKTNVANAKADLHQAEVNLGYAEIYSPIDGVVLNRAVEQGQTVAASFSTPTLFTIANDLTKMQVEANVDEADIGQVRVGQRVTFSVDSYADDIFEGTVKQLRLQPTVTSNVVTYTVIVEAPNPEEKLFPGMTASITVITHSEEGLAVPAEALQFNPTPDILAKMGKSSSQPKAMPKGQPGKHPLMSKGVWVKTANGTMHKELKISLSDGVNTLVLDGLNAGDTVILSASLEKKSNKQSEAAVKNPLMPQPRRRR